MIDIALPYGQGYLTLRVDDRTHGVSVLNPYRGNPDLVRQALAAPIGSAPLRQIVKPGEKLAVITSDITRPCPTSILLPPLMEELNRAGIKDEDVTVVFGLGTHRAHTVEEQVALVGEEMYRRVSCIDSNPENTCYVGTTARGTPIEVFEPVLRAQRRVALGNVELHYFAGYSGGMKALVPGVCSRDTIQHNHAMMLHTNARSGVLEDNPIREDIEEGGNLIGLDFILNVILDSNHSIVTAAAGHPIEAHRWLCRILDHQSKVHVDTLADIVVVSAGGYPKDINVYQAQKALDNAASAVKQGGIIIWVAECGEGFGNSTFERWLLDKDTDSILADIQSDFVLGGHKAAAITQVLQHARVWLVSDLPTDTVRRAGFSPYNDLMYALEEAIALHGTPPLITVLPEGASVLPSLRYSDELDCD